MQPKSVEWSRVLRMARDYGLAHNLEERLLNSQIQQRVSAMLQQQDAEVAAAWQANLRALSREAARLALAEVQAAAMSLADRQQPQGAAATSERQQHCQRIGERIRQARCTRRWSIEQLARQTYIPPFQIAAIESGQLTQPDDDIYLRGFLQRLGTALGLEVEALLADLPAVAFSPIPSWYRQELMLDRPSLGHYCGYAAIAIGTAGVLGWSLQQMQVHLPSPASQQPSVGQRTQDELGESWVAVAIAPPERLAAPETSRS